MVKLVVMVVLFVLGLCSGGHSSAADFPFFAKRDGGDGGKTVNVIATFLATFPEHAVFFHYQNHTRHLVNKVLAKSSSSLANGVIALNYDSVSDPKEFHFSKQLPFVHVFLVQQLGLTDKMVDINKIDTKFDSFAFYLHESLHTSFYITMYKATFVYLPTVNAAVLHATCYYCAQRLILTQLPIGDDDDNLLTLVVRNFTESLNYKAQPLVVYMLDAYVYTLDPTSPQFKRDYEMQWFFHDLQQKRHFKLMRITKYETWDIILAMKDHCTQASIPIVQLVAKPLSIMYSASTTEDMEPWKVLIATFDSSVWLCLIASVLALTILSSYYHHDGVVNILSSIVDNLLLLLEQPVASIQQRYRRGGHIMSSMLTTIWLLMAFVLLNAYRGAFTGLMLKTTYTEFDDVKDLLSNNYSFYVSWHLFKSVTKALEENNKEKVALRTTHVPAALNYEVINKISYHKVAVVEYEFLLHQAIFHRGRHSRFSTEQQNNFRLIQKSIASIVDLIIIPTFLPVYRQIVSFVEDYHAGGLFQRWIYLREPIEKIPLGKSIHSEKFYQKRQRHFLESRHFYGIIISVWLYGLSLALGIFILEITVDGIIKYDVIRQVIRFVVYVYTLLCRLYKWLKATVRALVRKMVTKCKRRRRNKVTQQQQQPQVVVQRSTSCHDIAVIDLE